MAEIGIIASVIGVAGAGFRLSLILNAIGSEVANAGVEIHTISKGVTLFSLMLKQVGQHLQAQDSVHSQEALDTAKQITEECQQVFDEISDMLDRVQSKRAGGSSPTIQQRFKWCFKKHRVQYLLAQLESLKMSLLVMLQILQLGKLMASAAKSNITEDVEMKNDMISQERAETQNMVIVRYWAISRLDRLYHAADQEDQDDKAELEEQNQKLLANGQSQLALEAPPDYATSTALIRLPVVSLGELDTTLNRIKDSPRDMLHVSESVIDPLLDRWTRIKEIHDRRAPRPSAASARYTPSVHEIYESDEEHPHSFEPDWEHPDSPQAHGYFLEGQTTNWREPHSVAAKHEAAKMRQKYSGFQPSVDSDSEEYSPNPVKKQGPTRHIIDSSDTSSTNSEHDSPKHRQRRRRRSSGSGADKKRGSIPGDRNSSYGDRASNLTRYASSPNPTNTSQRFGTGPAYPQGQYPGRPHPHHSVSSPLPPLHTGNAMNPYSGAPFGAAPPPYNPYGNQPYGARNPMPPQGQRLQPPQPPSSDGKNRSPSRLNISPMNHPLTDEEKRIQKQRQKNMRKGATRGLLSVGAVAGFLEALEGLSI